MTLVITIIQRKKILDEQKQIYFDYLYDLRESGVTNMWGSPAYLERAFPELKGKKSTEVFLEWVEQY